MLELCIYVYVCVYTHSASRYYHSHFTHEVADYFLKNLQPNQGEAQRITGS